MEPAEKKARLKYEITVLRKRQSVKFALLNTGIFLLFYFLIDALITMAVEKRTIREFLQFYPWWKLPLIAIFWFLFSYFWLSRAGRRLLHKKEAELKRLEEEPLI